GFFLAGIHAAINVLSFAVQTTVIRFAFLVSLNHGAEHTSNLLGADFVLFAFVVGFNDLTESHSTAHGISVIQLLFAGVFAQGFPAADDLCGIIHFQGVIFAFEQILHPAADVLLVNGQDQYLVVTQQATLNSFREVD